jgi:hypothetical protein
MHGQPGDVPHDVIVARLPQYIVTQVPEYVRHNRSIECPAP